MTEPATPSSPTPFVLGAGLGIRESHELRSSLLAAIERGPLVLDASAVERADSAGVQLLISLARSLAARGESLAYAGASPALLEVARTLGVAEACHLPGGRGGDRDGG